MTKSNTLVSAVLLRCERGIDAIVESQYRFRRHGSILERRMI